MNIIIYFSRFISARVAILSYVVGIVCRFSGIRDRIGTLKMFLVSDRCAPLTSLFVLSALSALVRSQAPGDAEGNSCTKKPVPDGVVRLLDSHWYQSLLSNDSQNAGWTQTSEGSVSENHRHACI